MADFFDVEIEFNDGTTETITYASVEQVAEGVLNLFVVNNTYTKEREHLGSWPLFGIKKWTRRNR